jgi:hypothetical protein
MTRSVTRRLHPVQLEKASLTDAPRRADASSSSPRTGSAVPWYWQTVMFFWVTSFLGLLIYEWLAGIFKAW